MLRNRLIYTIAAFLLVAGTMSGCGGAKKAGEEDGSATAGAVDENSMGDSDSGQAMGLQTINFPYDSFALEGAEKEKLNGNAQILKDKASVKVQIEGHCDSRGGIQYNIALGEKRANAVRKYLVAQGIKGNRVTVISYGKERPLDPGASEDAMARNRRGNFVITAK